MTTAAPIRISAKNLGKLSMPDCCPRCFWLQLQMGFRLPYQIFPGIFSSLDSYQKRCIHKFCEKHGRLPSWISRLGDLVRPVLVLHHTKFQYLDRKTNVLLTGTPDDIYSREDGSLFIVDFKTAKFMGNQDKLHPMYATQLNCYALINEKMGLGSVSGLALVYFEPETERIDVDERIRDAGFNLGFSAHTSMVDLNLGQIPLLLQRARGIFDLNTAPASAPGCKDCKLVEGMTKLFGR